MRSFEYLLSWFEINIIYLPIVSLCKFTFNNVLQKPWKCNLWLSWASTMVTSGTHMAKSLELFIQESNEERERAGSCQQNPHGKHGKVKGTKARCFLADDLGHVGSFPEPQIFHLSNGVMTIWALQPRQLWFKYWLHHFLLCNLEQVTYLSEL